jgi:hypothetical protein
MQDPLLHPGVLDTPNSASASDSAGSQTARTPARRPWSAQPKIPLLPESRRESAEMIGLQWADENKRKFIRAGSVDSAKENKFMPRSDTNWAPPVVGYGGHVPGYASGNLHGSPWKVTVISLSDMHIKLRPPVSIYSCYTHTMYVCMIIYTYRTNTHWRVHRDTLSLAPAHTRTHTRVCMYVYIYTYRHIFTLCYRNLGTVQIGTTAGIFPVPLSIFQSS